MDDAREKFIQQMKHPARFRMFLFLKVPAAWFCGVRLQSIAAEKCEASIPYRWSSRNPFRSTYFASLSMAAELTTGALGLIHSYGRQPAISMLVTRVEGDFFKKAVDKTIFTCEDGESI